MWSVIGALLVSLGVLLGQNEMPLVGAGVALCGAGLIALDNRG